MKHCGYCSRDLPSGSFAKRKASPDGLSYKCRGCDKAYRESRGSDKYCELRRQRYIKNRRAEKLVALEYYRENRRRCIERHAAYMAETADKQRQYRRETAAQCLARVAKRRAALEQRTPPWLTREQFEAIVDFYELRRELEAKTGVPHHVDHVVPLRGRKVSGLHVPWNLQVIPATANISKGNKYASL